MGLDLACNGGSCGGISIKIKTPHSNSIPGYEYCLLTEMDPEVHKTRSGGRTESIAGRGKLGLRTE